MVLFIHTSFSSFIRIDYHIIEKHFPVRRFQYQSSKKLLSNLYNQFKLFFWLLKNVWRSDTIFVYFADYHAFFPILFAKIFQKKSVIVLAGYDTTSIPELQYGAFYKPLRGFCAGYAIENANYLLPVDSSLIDEAKVWVKDIKGEIHTIPYGFDEKKWFCDTKKENIVLSVGNFDIIQRIKRKGIDLLLDIAKILKDYQFVLVGVTKEGKKLLDISPNVRLVEKVTQDELRNYYSRAKVYAQFSMKEGFPNVVGEAMLCECIPVGSNANGIPEQIGDCGFVLAEKDPQKGAILIEKALKSPESLGKKAQKRVAELFTPERREKGFLTVLKR